MEPTSYVQFIDQCGAQAGLADRSDAVRAVEATLSVLGEGLGREQLAILADQLPSEMIELFERRSYRGRSTESDFYERISALEGVERGFAMEHAQVVCMVLAGTLDQDGLDALARAVADELQVLFTPRESSRGRALGSTSRRVWPGAGRTLATGRPGSQHPVAEATGQPGQSDSIVARDVPHDETKLSSTRGSSAERRGDSLAVGRGGSKRPLSEEGGS